MRREALALANELAGAGHLGTIIIARQYHGRPKETYVTLQSVAAASTAGGQARFWRPMTNACRGQRLTAGIEREGGRRKCQATMAGLRRGRRLWRC